MISLYFADVFALLRNRVLSDFEVALAQKAKMQRHCIWSAKSGLAACYFDPRWAFKAKVGQEHGALPDRQIKHQEAARQSRENKARIAPSGSFSMV